MALVAAHAGEQASMVTRLSMTGGAIGRETGEFSAGMTAVAGKPGMAAGQREELVMIEIRRQPGFRGMASAAGCSELAVVGIFGCMAGITGAGSASEDLVHMTALTRRVDMRSS